MCNELIWLACDIPIGGRTKDLYCQYSLGCQYLLYSFELTGLVNNHLRDMTDHTRQVSIKYNLIILLYFLPDPPVPP